MYRSSPAVVALAGFLLAASALAQGKNLLFYGNSYSSRNGTVANMVQLIAMQKGHPSPTIIKRFASGQTLNHHATNPAQVAAISTSLAPGQTWDFVVMQGQSTEATQALGNPGLFRNRAQAITNNVRGHSPMARAVLYQTWARATPHHYYPYTFSSPMAMHNEIRGNYRLAVADINSQHGPAVAENCAVGDGTALLEWAPAFYEPDLFHPLPTMTLLAGMCLYTSIYDELVCDLQVNFGQAGPLVNWLTSLGLSQSDWHRMAALADRVAAPALRAHPGSGDHLLLESGALPIPASACSHLEIGTGTFLALQLTSKNGAFDGVPALLMANVFINGSPPGPSLSWPELHIDTGGMVVLATSPDLTTPLSWFAPLPFSFPGLSVMVQGLAWGPSSETGNSNFATTDAHILVFQ